MSTLTANPSLCTVHNPRRTLKGEWLVEPKIDGCRLLIVVEQGNATAYSRTGNPQPKLQCFADHVATLYNNCIVDCELFARDLGSTIAVMRGTMSDSERLRRARLHQFDLITLEEAKARKTAPIEERKARLLTSNYCRVIEWQVVPGSTVKSHLAPYLSRGYEGIVVKKAGSQYTFRRLQDWQKHKPQRKNKRLCEVATGATND